MPNQLKTNSISIAAFQPDIPQNTGSLIRLCACMGTPFHIIEPCGFLLDNKLLQRTAMDYNEKAEIIRHLSWEHFLAYTHEISPCRLLLFSTHASNSYTEFHFQAGDILLLGRESAGVPEYVRQASDGYLRIPLQPGARSLNIVQAACMALGEALRQTNSFPAHT